MKVYPNAKINLGLNIIRKREDGYHDLETVMYPIPLYDELEIEEADELSFETDGIKLEDDGKENLVVRAYRLMAEHCHVRPVKIHLTKNVPSGAGLGGGSADAAFTLKALNELFSIGASDNDLKQMASRLGADCALFIENKPMMCRGIGDKMSPVSFNLKGHQLLVIKPDVHISTAEAYRGCTPAPWSTPLSEIISQPLDMWKNVMKNDFEPQVFALHDELRVLKKRIYDSGAIYSAMTGSGSSFYGIYKKGTLIDSFSEYQHYKLDL